MTHVDGHWFTRLSFTCKLVWFHMISWNMLPTPARRPLKTRSLTNQDSLGDYQDPLSILSIPTGPLIPRLLITGSSCLLVNTPNEICYQKIAFCKCGRNRNHWCLLWLTTLNPNDPDLSGSQLGFQLQVRYFSLYTIWMFVQYIAWLLYIILIHAYTHIFAYLFFSVYNLLCVYIYIYYIYTYTFDKIWQYIYIYLLYDTDIL